MIPTPVEIEDVSLWPTEAWLPTVYNDGGAEKT